MAEEATPSLKHGEARAAFSVLEFEMTDVTVQGCVCLWSTLFFFPCIMCAPGVMGKKRLTLEAEEAVFVADCPCAKVNTRRPYGELGSVDRVSCCGCIGVGSSLFPGKEGAGCVFPGWGCETAKVEEVVAEMKARMKARGDTGNILRLEEQMVEIKAARAEIAELKADMQLLLQHFSLKKPEQQTMSGQPAPTVIGAPLC